MGVLTCRCSPPPCSPRPRRPTPFPSCPPPAPRPRNWHNPGTSQPLALRLRLVLMGVPPGRFALVASARGADGRPDLPLLPPPLRPARPQLAHWYQSAPP